MLFLQYRYFCTVPILSFSTVPFLQNRYFFITPILFYRFIGIFFRRNLFFWPPSNFFSISFHLWPPGWPPISANHASHVPPFLSFSLSLHSQSHVSQEYGSKSCSSVQCRLCSDRNFHPQFLISHPSFSWKKVNQVFISGHELCRNWAFVVILAAVLVLVRRKKSGNFYSRVKISHLGWTLALRFSYQGAFITAAKGTFILLLRLRNLGFRYFIKVAWILGTNSCSADGTTIPVVNLKKKHSIGSFYTHVMFYSY